METNMYSQDDPFLRNDDGMINFDRYRVNATALRRQAMEDTSKLRSVLKLIVVVLLLLGMVVIAPPRHPDDGNAAAANQTTSRTAAHGSAERPLF
jgi:hypothetical protein